MPVAACNGIDIGYALDGAGPTVVCINALFSTQVSWAWVKPLLISNYRLLTYDCRGQGESSKPDADIYRMEDHLEDLISLLDTLSIDKAHVVGLSFGAALAQFLASRHPERVQALVLSSTASGMFPHVRVITEMWLDVTERFGSTTLFETVWPIIFGDAFIEQHFDIIEQTAKVFASKPVSALLALNRGLLAHEMSFDLARFRGPTLLTVGDEDSLTLPHYSRDLQKRIPGAELAIIKHSGHVPPIEQPDAFAAVVRQFLGRYPLAPVPQTLEGR